MRVAVGISNDPDSFEAGKHAAEKALEKHPISRADLIVVFSSVRYANPQLLKGIRSVTGPVPLVGCTDAGGIDPFVEIAAGRSLFRYEDLVRLADLLEGLR